MTLKPDVSHFANLRTLNWPVEAGDGRPVLIFLHGLGDGADIWRPVLDHWPAPRHLPAVAFDLPGHGGSDWLDASRYTVTKLAGEVTDAIQAAGIKKSIIVGHSLGARVALEISADGIIDNMLTVLVDLNPEPSDDKPSAAQSAVGDHLDALIAGASSADQLVATLKDRLPMADLETLATFIRRQISIKPQKSPRRVTMPLDPDVKVFLKTINRTDCWALLAEAMNPVAIVRGEYSGVLNKATATKMTQEVMRCVGDETIRGAGHAIALEQPKALAEALERVIAPRVAPLL